MTYSLHTLSATELLAGYKTKAFSPVEVMQDLLERVSTVNPALNALVFINEEDARKSAAQSEARWLRGEPMGKLDGVPVTIKDSIAVNGMPMLRGNKANAGNPPSQYDSPPAMRVREAGGIMFAKTTMPDFGLLVSGVSSAYGITRNPWNTALNPGGSTAGGAAAAASMCGPLAVGSDIGGSVRFPAAMCGLVGLKPTQGRIPHLPPSPVRSAGPLARTAEDAGLLLDVLSGYDGRDYDALPPTDEVFSGLSAKAMKGVRILLVLEGDTGHLPEPAVAAAVRKAAKTFEAAGAIVDEAPSVVGGDFMEIVSIPLLLRGLAEFLKLSDSALEKTPSYFVESFTKAKALGADKIALALDSIEAVKTRVLNQMVGYDFLISPISGMSGFPAEATRPSVSESTPIYTPVWNQTGNPATSICCGFDSSNEMPIGLQIVGHRFNDLGVLQLSRAYEDIRGFEMNWPTPV